MRLIDADALVDRLDYCVKEGMGSTIAFTFKHMVEDAPSIDIVFCKECKHEPICSHSVCHTTHELTSVTIGYKSVEWCSCGQKGDENVETDWRISKL